MNETVGLRPAPAPGAATRFLRAPSATAVRRAAEVAFALIAVASAAAAFVGLSATGWWTDELFTLFVIDHLGGAPEVLRRALTDTQPPGYYLLLNAWSQLAGVGEVGLRSLSAIMAVAGAALFAWTTRGFFSGGARALAVAVGVTSPFWFVQSQNIRTYSLCLLLAAAMLALALRLRREVRAGSGWPWASWAALTLVGALDASAHFYGLLGFDALALALAVTLRSWPLRVALAVSVLGVTGGEAAYVRLLVGHTHENFQHLWFRKDPARLLAVSYDVWKLGVGGAARGAVLLLAAGWAATEIAGRRRGAAAPPPTRGEERDVAWLAGVSAFVLAAVYLGGVAVSLAFAPSLSDRNVLTAAPMAWALLAALYDAALRRLGPRAGAALAVVAAALLAFHAVAIARGRALPRNEPWRETARYVAALPACRGAVLDAVQPDKFGPDTPFYRMIARRWFFGRYLGEGWPRVLTHPRAAFADPRLEPELAARIAARAHDPRACPVLAWAVHDVDTREAQALRDGVARLPGVAPAPVRLRSFEQAHFLSDRWTSRPAGYVVERAAPP